MDINGKHPYINNVVTILTTLIPQTAVVSPNLNIAELSA